MIKNRKKLHCQYTRLLILLSFLFFPTFCFAQNLLQHFEHAKQGQLPIPKLLDFITTSDDLSISAKVSRYKHLVPGLSETSAPYLLKKTREAVMENNFAKVWQIKSLADTLLPRTWPESIRIAKLASYASKIQEVEDDFISLNSIYKAKLVEQDKRILEIAAKKKVIELVSSEKDNFEAINLASKASVIFPNLNLEIRGIFLELSRDADFSKWNFDIPDVKDFVFDFLNKSSENRELVSNLYLAKAVDSFNQGNENRAEVYFNLISPHLNNSKKLEFKKEILKTGLNKDQLSSFTKSIISELKNNLSTTDKVKLLFKGYYGWWLFLIPIIIIILPVLIVLKPRKKSTLEKRAAVVEDDEYSRLLKKIGLEGDVSESQLKKAFRDLVKKHHPDAHGSAGVALDEDGNVDKQFEELRKTYDRILEIRSRWFGNS